MGNHRGITPEIKRGSHCAGLNRGPVTWLASTLCTQKHTQASAIKKQTNIRFVCVCVCVVCYYSQTNALTERYTRMHGHMVAE